MHPESPPGLLQDGLTNATDAPPPLAPPAASAPAPAIELLIGTQDAARIARLSALGAYRAGRPRRSSALIVWHDIADRGFAQSGYSLSETHGHWRLQPLHPGTIGPWYPATPAPVLAETDTRDALTVGMDPHLRGLVSPIAAFSGYQRDLALRIDGHAASLTVLEGNLRGVVESRAVCRLLLSGPPQAMARLALKLSEQVSLRVPMASLGAEALALADNTQPIWHPPGRLEIAPGSSVDAAFSSIFAHLAGAIHHWAPLVGAQETEEPVHQMRVALRRLRSALSIFRRAVRDDTAWLDTLAGDLQTLAATLGVARDWDVFIAGIGADITRAMDHDKRLTRMLAAAARKRQLAYDTLRTDLSDTPHWQRLGLTLALLPILRPWDDNASPEQTGRLAAPAETYAAGALDRRLKQLLCAGERLEDVPAETLHEIRKNAKRLRYAIEFFRPLFPQKQLHRYLAKLEGLQEDFGTFNDAAVATGLAASLGAGADRAFAAGAVHGFGAAAQSRARRRVIRGWSRFYRATPFWD